MADSLCKFYSEPVAHIAHGNCWAWRSLCSPLWNLTQANLLRSSSVRDALELAPRMSASKDVKPPKGPLPAGSPQTANLLSEEALQHALTSLDEESTDAIFRQVCPMGFQYPDMLSTGFSNGEAEIHSLHREGIASTIARCVGCTSGPDNYHSGCSPLPSFLDLLASTLRGAFLGLAGSRLEGTRRSKRNHASPEANCHQGSTKRKGVVCPGPDFDDHESHGGSSQSLQASDAAGDGAPSACQGLPWSWYLFSQPPVLMISLGRLKIDTEGPEARLLWLEKVVSHGRFQKLQCLIFRRETSKYNFALGASVVLCSHGHMWSTGLLA